MGTKEAAAVLSTPTPFPRHRWSFPQPPRSTSSAKRLRNLVTFNRQKRHEPAMAGDLLAQRTIGCHPFGTNQDVLRAMSCTTQYMGWNEIPEWVALLRLQSKTNQLLLDVGLILEADWIICCVYGE